jgi:type II secretory pathway predicted ATPase ExeA
MNTQFTAPLLKHFGLPPTLPTYVSAQHQMYQAELESAIDNNQLAAVIADRGAGKSTLARMAQAGCRARSRTKYSFVYVRNPDLEKLRMGHLMSEAAIQIAQESPKRDLTMRTDQFLRIVGSEMANDRRVTFVIEEAHNLTPAFLMDLKGLRERGFGIRFPEGPLFGVLLVGHPPLLEKLQRKEEVYWRTLTLELKESDGWMTLPERDAYLQFRFGDAIEEKTRTRLAKMHTVPLALDFGVATAMREAMLAGYDRVDERTVRLSIDERMALHGLSFPDLAKLAGVSQASAHNVKTGTASPDITDRVLSALDRLDASPAAAAKAA